MVVRLIEKLRKETYSIHKAALLIAALSLAAQILAVVRDKMLAFYFGAGSDLSLYYAAFRIPDMVYASLSSLMAAIIVLPLLTAGYQVSQERARKVIDSLCTVFIFVGIVVCGILYVLIPYLTQYVVPGFEIEEQERLVYLSRILLLSPLLLGISNLVGSILQMKKNFFFYALAPILYNMGIILGIYLFAPQYGIEGVVYGVVIGALFHISIQIPTAYVYGLAPRITSLIDWQLIREVFFVSLPRIATLVSIQFAQTFLVAQATYIAPGSVAIFSLAFNIQAVPLVIIGLSYSVAAFPVIAEYVAKNDFYNVWISVRNAMRHLIFWSLPVMCFVIVLRAHIVRILYGSGEFDWTDTRLTAAVLAVMIVALSFQTLSLLLMRALYALHQVYSQLLAQLFAFFVTYITVVYGMRIWATNPFAQSFFESLFRIEDLPDTEVLIIGMAHALGAITLTIGLLYIFKKKIIQVRLITLRTVLGQALGASIIGATTTYAVLTIVQNYISLDTFFGVVISAVIAFIPGAIAWLGILYILGSIELREFAQALKKRFWKTDIIQEELQEL